eukprot:3631714-Lingulodinium_polyedra.AAC.1
MKLGECGCWSLASSSSSSRSLARPRPPNAARGGPLLTAAAPRGIAGQGAERARACGSPAASGAAPGCAA